MYTNDDHIQTLLTNPSFVSDFLARPCLAQSLNSLGKGRLRSTWYITRSLDSEGTTYHLFFTHPGGKELASTTSSASFWTSSFGPCSGDRGRAIKPVLADSRIPNGEMSFMNESIRVGFADLLPAVRRCRQAKSGGKERSHLNNTIISTYIQNLPSELMRQMRNRLQMLMLMPQRLTRR